MQITLKNFKCYTDKTFEFCDDTMTLINGPSGYGKSTLLLGIKFALYGLTNHKFLISHNKASCEVILIYKNFKIKRTKRPNILNLEFNGQFYEDKEAQVILNKYFGIINSTTFFMDLSHLEKMEFLEQIVNSNYDIKDLKNKIKLEIQELAKKITIIDSQITNTESMLEIIQKPDKVEKPIFCGSLELLKLPIEKLITRKKETLDFLKSLNETKQQYDKIMAQINVIRDEIDSFGSLDHKIQVQIDDITKKLLLLKTQNNQMNENRDKMFMVEDSLKELEKFKNINDENLLKIQCDIDSIDKKIAQCIKFKEANDYLKLLNEYNDAFNLEYSEWKTRVDLIQSKIKNLNMDKEALNNLEYNKKIYDQFKDKQMFNSKYDLKKINDQIEALKSKFFKSFVCGRCNHTLTINMVTMQMVKDTFKNNFFNETALVDVDTIKSELYSLETLKLKLEANLKIISEIDEEKLKVDITLCEEYKTLDAQLASFKPSIYLTNMETKLNKIKVSLDDKIIITDDLDILKDEKRDLTIQQSQMYQKIKVKNNLLQKVKTKEKYEALEHQKIKDSIESYNQALIEKYSELEKLKTFLTLNGRLKALNNQLSNLNYNDESIPQNTELLDQINSSIDYYNNLEKYMLFIDHLKKYKKVKDTFKKLKENKKEMEQMYLKTILFKQKVIESEHESLQFMVNIINTHLSILLQDFFSESFGDPIQIYLELTNEKRPQVDIIINYKGNRTDHKSLSTGEYARVQLAFDLVFKEILGQNIIMLDECTANLDQDLSTKIFNTIKASFPSKTILVVAHQVIKGTFDHVLQL